MSIDWVAFVQVFGVSLLAACLVVLCFAGAIRLLATPPRGAPGLGGARDEEMDAVERGSRPRIATAGASALLVVAALTVLLGVYLIVPAFHG